MKEPTTLLLVLILVVLIAGFGLWASIAQSILIAVVLTAIFVSIGFIYNAIRGTYDPLRTTWKTAFKSFFKRYPKFSILSLTCLALLLVIVIRGPKP